jgi:hypothetical protein
MIKSSKFFCMIGLLFASASGWASDQESLKASGFVDAQYQIRRGALKVTNTMELGGQVNTFTVHQGALYLSKKIKSSDVFVDIPFVQNATAGNLTLATTQAQAYVSHTYDFGLTWTAGQFDTIYGFEVNDTKDIFFTTQGPVYGILPVTHTGFMAAYKIMDGLKIHALVGNANQAGFHTAGNAMEFGGRLNFEHDWFRAGAGILANKQDGNYVVGTQTHGYQTAQTIDITFGGTFNGLSFDGAVDMVQSGQAKVVDRGTVADKGNAMGLFGQLTYQANDEVTVGVKYESVTNNAGDALITAANTVTAGTFSGKDHQRTMIGAGIKYKLDDGVFAKADVRANTFKGGTNGESVNWADGAVGVVAMF